MDDIAKSADKASDIGKAVEKVSGAEKGTELPAKIADKTDDISDINKTPKPSSEVPEVQKGGEVKNPTAPDKTSDIAKAEDKRIVPETGDDIGKTADKISKGEKPSIEFLYEERGSRFYKNKKETKLRISNQSDEQITKLIEKKLNSTSSGDIVEGEVAKYIRENTSKKIEYFSAEVENMTSGGNAGEIDIMTEDYLIEVKRSINSVKNNQLSRYINSDFDKYINIGDKKVIIFIKEKIKNTNAISNLENMYDNKIKIVNSLDELGEILK